MITQEREDYLKTIYKLQHKESPVRTTSIARALGIEPASVTGVIKRLSELKLVKYQPYKGVTLTETGEKIALEVLRHHRLIELYLLEALGYSWDEVHDEAERLEHVVSDLFEERIAAALGHPEIDPHGAPIPTKDGTIAAHTGHLLSEMEAGQSGHILQVNDDDPGLLRYLGGLGLQPGVHLTVLQVAPYGGPIRIQADDKTHDLGVEAAAFILVKVDEEETSDEETE